MSTKKMWGGRFTGSVDPVFEEFSESVSFDRELALMDLAGSRAHAKVLHRAGILDQSEFDAVLKGLDEVRREVRAGVLTWRVELEDVHMNVEQRLTELIGDAGKKLHTGRSRNDQVALDFRLHVDERLASWQQGLALLVEALAERAGEHVDTLLPGCTHMQPAQPVSLAQHLLAYCQMFMRDHARMGDCRKRVRVSPLGAAALAGNILGLDPGEAARELGFESAFANSMDAVSDRDFAAEALFDAALVMTHLSRLCEEIILWASPRFGFVKLPDAYATGSSIMPQKKNPDAAELIRGKTGRVYGALVTLLTVLKGLPLTYNRDLQEDKEPFFDADRTVGMSLAVAAPMVGTLGFVVERMAEAVREGFLNATELADYLAAKGVPFRRAHEIAGQAVALAEGQGKRLEELELAELQGLEPRIDEDVYTALDYATAVARRSSPGGTGPEPVRKQLADVRQWLKEAAA